MTVDSPIVTLVEVGVEYRSDGELWGGIVIRRKGGEARLYAQCLPQYPHVDPPGWAAIADITGVSAEMVIAGWDETGKQNAEADRAFAVLRDYVGKSFLAREMPGIDSDVAIELVPIRVDDPNVHIDIDEGRVIGNEERVFVLVQAIALNVHPNDEEPPTFAILSDNALPRQIQIPDADHDPDPTDWFFIETLTGCAASRIAYSWSDKGVPKRCLELGRVQLALNRLLVGRHAALGDDGFVDLNALRRALVRQRFAYGIEPYLHTGRHIKDVCQRAWILLTDTLGPHLFRYNVERGVSSGVPAVIRSVDGPQKLEVLDELEKIRGVLLHHIDFCGGTKGRAIQHVTPPNTCAEHMMLFADQSVPAIDTLVRIPTVRKDGTIHDTEGYDPKSRIWYAPEFKLEPIPEQPTSSDMRAALEQIVAPFAQFPFVEEAGSLSATIACLVDQIVRPMIAGARPLFAFDAPAIKGQGTGKSRLAGAIGAIITGREVEVTPWPDDPKELPKTITAKLLASEPFVIFDNLEGVIRHKDLAALATTTMWSSRLLHTNDTPRLPQTATWCMTLNGARYSPDIARRTLTIKLDAKTADPHKRTGFKIENLIPWCIRHRAQIIRACLILVRAWVVAGRPRDTRFVAGSFEPWQEIVGGVLYHAGLTGLPLTIEESQGRNVDAQEHDSFIARWAENFGLQPVTAVQLAGLAELHSLYGSILENAKTPNWKGRHMTELLRKLNGYSFGGLKVMKSETRVHGSFIYQLAQAPHSNGVSTN